ncbi:MAG: flavodoxin family protein [Thermotogaceae bacterium]|nr:flavodoxin family protein [Thermotogaceae bacterium]
MKAIAFNGSPRMERGYTSRLLSSLLKGIQSAGYDTELFYTNTSSPLPCTCGSMHCWDIEPGICCMKDSMQPIYQKIKESEILVLAAPVYIPLPGEMQNLINRLCPMIDPVLSIVDGRTRAKLRAGWKTEKILLVSTGGWWEKENFDTLIRIVRELAENASVVFSGALIRPHVHLMFDRGDPTDEGKEILLKVEEAGCELVRKETIDDDLLKFISRPLISHETFVEMWNR